MKNLCAFLLVAFCSIGHAQIVDIASVNFKFALRFQTCADTNDDGIADSDVDTNDDGEIQLSEALAVTGLTINTTTFPNMPGINAFANLKTLVCSGGNLSSLTISGLHQLRSIDCSNNGLYSVSLTGLDQLESLNCFGNQILTVLDLSGSNNLKNLNCSLCRLSALDVTDFPNLETLNCRQNVILTSLTIPASNAITSFNCGNNPQLTLDYSIMPNLKFLQCDSNGLNAIDFSSLGQLEELQCYSNNLSAIDLSNLAHLKTLNCGTNHLSALDLSHAPNLEHLKCSQNNLAALDCSLLNNLKTMDCSENGLTVLELSNLANLIDLNCSKNTLTALTIPNSGLLKKLNCTTNNLPAIDVAGLTSLETLDCSKNHIAALDLNNATHLKTLDCSFNQLTNLDAIHSVGLEILRCGVNQLTELNIAPLVNLRRFSCTVNQISDMDFSHNNTLFTIEVGSNLFTSLDFSQTSMGAPAHYEYDVSNNHNLAFLNLKNGGPIVNSSFQDPSGIYVDGCENLLHICADEFNFGYLNVLLPTTTMNSYCSFTPGGTFNTITGNYTLDYDNNGCDANDHPFSNGKITIDDGSQTGATFTNASGDYTFYTQTGNFVFVPTFEHPYFTVTPASAVVNFESLGAVHTQNFCVTPNGIHNDVEIIINPTNAARPGFNCSHSIAYKNKGNQILSGDISLNFDDAVLDVVSANPEPNVQSLNTLNWTYENLMPFESHVIYVTLNVNSPQETPPVNLGDILNFTATINPVLGDDTVADNTFELMQTVVGSFDPNDKTCLEGESVDPQKVGDYLHYVVRFQNSGTFAAENVVVKDALDAEVFDVSSFQLVASSHPHATRINGNNVEFIFEGINLPAEQDDEPASHGFVAFKIKTKNTLAVGDAVSNKADIFFDYNLPIATNTATSVFQLLAREEFEDTSIALYPNPASDWLTISAKENIQSIQLYDVMGRLIQSELHNGNTFRFDLSQKASGIYFVKISTGKGTKTEKIIKQ